MKNPKFIRADRRTFLKGAAVAGGAAVVAAPTTTLANAAPAEELVAAPAAHKGYEENSYIKDYYKLARF